MKRRPKRSTSHRASEPPAGSATEPKAAIPVESFRLGPNRYEIIQRLSLPDRGRWLVRDRRPPPKGTRRVAIVLPNDAQVAQLRRSLLRLPIHANFLPRLIDHGRIGDDYCLILDWLPGIDLGEYLKRVDAGRTPRPSVTESLRLVRGLSHSLRLLHEACRVIHGDLKPENLILTVKPSSLRLIDFGSSWQIERTRHRLPGDGFDPHYAAPENFSDEPRVSAASDQFSVGVILFRLLTRQLPYEGLGGKVGYPEYRGEFDGEVESAGELLERRDELPDVLKRDIDCLLGTMLQIDPVERYPHSRAWTDAIDRVARRIDALADPPDTKPTSFDRAANWLLRKFAGRLDRRET